MSSSKTLGACAFGSYRPDRFIARMRPEMWEALIAAKHLSGTREIERHVVEEYSTYLHETIHWWQCIGTTYGLILSLTPASKTHATRSWIHRLSSTLSLRKPLTDLADERDQLNADQREQFDIILNHWHDLDFNARVTLSGRERLNDVIQSPYFHSIGRGLHIALADTLWLLASTFDPALRFIPDSRDWDAAFLELERREVEGYYRGSPVVVPQISARDIFEAQARFNQLQYLYLSSEERMSWNDFGSRGLLRAEYTEAFRFYLEAVGIQWPRTPVSPETNLFLLLCDLALNPADGYPFEILDAQSFTITNNPSMRFAFFCTQVAKNLKLLKAIQRCSHEEYLEVSMLLCLLLGSRTPIEICAEVVRWLSIPEGLETLLKEDAAFSFPNENLVVRVCFAKHLRFLEDKLSAPHFYCWPATLMVECWNEFDAEKVKRLLTPHLPLFVGSGDEEVKLAIGTQQPTANALQTFNDFYRCVIQYDLANQWISQSGPFDFNFTDIHPALKAKSVRKFAEADFFDLWGVPLSDVFQ